MHSQSYEPEKSKFPKLSRSRSYPHLPYAVWKLSPALNTCFVDHVLLATRQNVRPVCRAELVSDLVSGSGPPAACLSLAEPSRISGTLLPFVQGCQTLTGMADSLAVGQPPPVEGRRGNTLEMATLDQREQHQSFEVLDRAFSFNCND